MLLGIFHRCFRRNQLPHIEPDNGNQSYVKYGAKSELVFVRDEAGYVEVPPPNDYIWASPDIYKWTHGIMNNNVMCYYFDFTEP